MTSVSSSSSSSLSSSSSSSSDDDDDTGDLPCVFVAIGERHLLVVRPHTTDYITILSGVNPLNVEYIAACFTHPLNGTLPLNSDITDACHLHYDDSTGIHIVKREGVVLEVGFAHADCERRLYALMDTLNDTPFMTNLRVADRRLTNVTLSGKTNFTIDIERLCTQADWLCIRLKEQSQQHVIFNYTMNAAISIECYTKGDILLRVSGEENVNNVAMILETCERLVNTLAPYSLDMTMEI